jgi:predicted flap endonuclease-1-like 5' DNA nuclease
MSSFLSSLSNYWFWLLLGGVIGWLLNRYMCKYCSKPSANPMTIDTPAAPDKMADAALPVAKVTAPKVAAAKAVPKVVAVTNLAAAKKAGFALKNANDLTAVEGMGPKINELFSNAGVKTFAQLSKQSIPQMRKVLDDGGSRFRIANPGTWAQQAALAAENKWDELKKLQDNLSGGVKK